MFSVILQITYPNPRAVQSMGLFIRTGMASLTAVAGLHYAVRYRCFIWFLNA